MNPIYGGIDLGTQGVRIALFDAGGVMKAEAPSRMGDSGCDLGFS